MRYYAPPTSTITMKEVSRTRNSIINSRVALLYTLLLLALNFFSRKIFLDNLSAELLGLNTTLTNILQFLNIAESGFSFAICASLYKSYADKNLLEINEIITLNGMLYHRIGIAVIVCGIVIMGCFPIIFDKSGIEWYYPYIAFTIILIASSINYFCTYKQIILVASQQIYKIKYSYQSFIAIKLVVQMIAVSYLPYKYAIWLALEFIFAITAALSLHICIKKNSGYFVKTAMSYSMLKNKYALIINKTKQLLYHRIGVFTLQQTTPLIIYGFSTLTIVTVYYNYYLLFFAGVEIIRAIIESITPSIGNMIHQSNEKHSEKIYFRLFNIQFIAASLLCAIGYCFASPAIALWLGEEYVMEHEIVTLMIVWTFMYATKNVTDSYLNAYGAYSDVFAPITEVILSISLSIIFGIYLDLKGIILGMVIGMLIITFIWKPIYLFHYVMKTSYRKYILSFAGLIVLGIISAMLSKHLITSDIYNNWGGLLLDVICFTVLYLTILTALMSLIFSEQRVLNKTIFNRILHNRKS